MRTYKTVTVTRHHFEAKNYIAAAYALFTLVDLGMNAAKWAGIYQHMWVLAALLLIAAACIGCMVAGIWHLGWWASEKDRVYLEGTAYVYESGKVSEVYHD